MAILNATNKFGAYNYVVDPIAGKGSHTTISAALTDAQAAITAGSGPINIFIHPATYVENFTAVPNVNLISANGNISGNTIIQGTVTITAAGSYNFYGIVFETNGANIANCSGTAVINATFDSCRFNCGNAILLNNTNANANIFFRRSTGNLTSSSASAGYISSSGGIIYLMDCQFYNNSLNSTGGFFITGGLLKVINCEFYVRIVTSGTGSVNMAYTVIDTSAVNVTCLSIGGSVISTCTDTRYNTGTVSAIVLAVGTQLTLTKSVVGGTNANPISQTGAATIRFDDVTIGNTTGSINVSTRIYYKVPYLSVGLITFDAGTTFFDYAEGTFTPTAASLAGGVANGYSGRSARWTRMGNRIIVTYFIGITSVTVAGGILYFNLPITSANVGQNWYNSGYFYNGSISQLFDLLYEVQGATSSVFVQIPGATGTGNNWLTLTAGQGHRAQVIYEV